MKNILMTFFGIMAVSTFSSGEVLINNTVSQENIADRSEVRGGEKQAVDLSIRVAIEPLQNSVNGVVGSTGFLELGNFEGVKLEGVYTEITDNPYIALTSDGKWKALKSGKTKIVVVVTLSENTVKALEDKYPGREIVYPEHGAKQLEVNINEAAEKISLDYHFSPASIQAETGSTGMINVGTFEDISLTGTFKEIKNNPFIEVSSDGKWKALKAGKTAIMPNFTLSEESYSKINKKYPHAMIVTPEKQQLISVEISDSVDKGLGIHLEPLENEIIGVVGDSGKLDLGKFEGVKLEGIFSAVKDNPYIELASDGVWKALKVGKTNIYVTVQLTDETIQKLKDKYPDKEIILPTKPPKAIPVVIGEKKSVRNKEIEIVLPPVQDSINALVGDSGRFDLGTYEDIQLEGIYTEISDNPYIQLSKDGAWKAMKAGETTIVVSVSLSDKTLNLIREKYPERKISYSTVPPKKLKVTISEPNRNKLGTYVSENVTKSNRELPKTGSSKTSIYFQIVGLFFLICLVSVIKKRKEIKR
ncbi:TPA: PepSY-like domain-containing protein [Enterococcus faecalis]|nr:PepSY-like domain-containing protein [Enterococcus faecalis]